MTKDDYNQVSNIEYVKEKLGGEMWVQVCGPMQGEQRRSLFCVFIDKISNEKFLEGLGDGLSYEEPVGLSQIGDEIIYSFGKYEDICYLARYREFYGVKEGYFELCDEFLLNYNAYKEGDKYYSIDDSHYS